MEAENPKHSTKREQWGGVVERGRPSSLRLFRLDPKMTSARAPGPGFFANEVWAPVVRKRLDGREVILHTDVLHLDVVLRLGS